MIITQASLDALRVGLGFSFDAAYKTAPTFWEKLATKVPSTTRSNVYGWVAKQLKLREWVGERVAQNLSEHAHTVTNKKYEGTIEVDRDDLEDDNLGMYSSLLVPQLAEAAKKYPDDLLKTVLQGETMAFDGHTLFDDDHPTYATNGAATTYDNDFGLALTADNLNIVYSAMGGYVGEDGDPLVVTPNTLIIPPQLRKTSMEIVSAPFLAGGATNVMQGWVTILEIPQLANEPTEWYLADLTGAIKPFVFQERRAPEFVSRDNIQDPKVFERDIFTYGVSARGAIGVTLPFLIARSKP